jgi:hypothetical protein
VRTEIPPYLRSHLDVADGLPAVLDDVPAEIVESLQRRIRELVALVATRDRTIEHIQREARAGADY